MHPDHGAYFLMRWKMQFAQKVVQVANIQKSPSIINILEKHGKKSSKYFSWCYLL